MFRSPLARAAAVCALAATFAACGSSTEPKRRDNVPATITSTTTGALTGQAGATLNTLLSVVVKNAAGQGADSALVTFTVTSGGGSLSNQTVRTDTTGVASTTWTLGGTAGAQTVTATVGTLPAVTFTATATAAAASAIAKVAGDNQTALVGANVATAPSVKITDKFGNPVANVLVNFLAANGGSTTNSSVTTDANGIAAVGSWKLGPTVGANTLTATATNIGSVTFTATGTVGAISRVTITSPAIPTLTAGQTSTVTAAAFDANNNPIANPSFTFQSSNVAVATVSGTGLVTAVGAGTATISVTANGVSATTTVTVIGHPGVTVVSTLPQSGRVKQIATAGDQAYAAVSTSGSLSNVDMTSGAQGWTLTLGGQVNGVGVNTANTVIGAASTNGWFYVVSPSTHLAIDSIALGAQAVRMVMTSNGARAFVDENNFQVEVIDIASRAVISTIPLGGTVTAMKMGPGDSLFYVGTQFGNIFEVRVSNGTVKRQFQPTASVVDLDISPDGKTMVVADGTADVQLVSLASGGLSGTVTFTGNVNAVAFPPDFSALWVGMGTVVKAAPRDPSSGTFFPNAAANTVTVAGANFTRIAFSANGASAIAFDDGGLNLVVLK